MKHIHWMCRGSVYMHGKAKVYRLQQCEAVCTAYAIKHERKHGARTHVEDTVKLFTNKQTHKSHITYNKYAWIYTHQYAACIIEVRAVHV